MESETPHLQCLTEESSQGITAVLVNYTGEPLGNVESLSVFIAGACSLLNIHQVGASLFV